MRRGERGFTLIEILIALVVFAIVAIGALAALGATTASGFLGAFPTSFTTVRTAKDYTAAATYLQSLDDFIASRGKNAVAPDTYCIENVSGECSPLEKKPAGWDSEYPKPPSQLGWKKLDVVVERWYWNQVTLTYTKTGTGADYAVMVRSTLTWVFKRDMTLEVSRIFSCSTTHVGCP